LSPAINATSNALSGAVKDAVVRLAELKLDTATMAGVEGSSCRLGGTVATILEDSAAKIVPESDALLGVAAIPSLILTR
jgi:hypothetical protein